MGAIKYSRYVSIFAMPFLILGVEARAESPGVPCSILFSSRVTTSHALSSLPEQIKAPDGQLSLFADYDDVNDHTIALYLVNRTDKRIGFSAQDSDIYVKLEALNETGEWERAQVHWSSWCGNSYHMTPGLRPDEFFKFGGYHPQAGERRTVRYRVYQDYALVLDDDQSEPRYPSRQKSERLAIHLVSNSGPGMVSLKAIADTHRDSLAIAYGSLATVRDIALGTIPQRPLGWPKLSRRRAVRALRRFPSAEALALLETLIDETDRGIPPAAVGAIAVMGLEFEAAEKRFQELLNDVDIGLRTAAVRALSERPVTPDVLLYVQELLADDELWIRFAAMSVLGGECGEDPEIRALLNRLYQSPDPKLRSVFETMVFPTCIDYPSRHEN